MPKTPGSLVRTSR